MVMSLYFNAAMCDDCWKREEGDREPHRLKEPYREREVCAYCGRETMSGIYVRKRREA
jgi:hypothetical protein